MNGHDECNSNKMRKRPTCWMGSPIFSFNLFVWIEVAPVLAVKYNTLLYPVHYLSYKWTLEETEDTVHVYQSLTQKTIKWTLLMPWKAGLRPHLECFGHNANLPSQQGKKVNQMSNLASSATIWCNSLFPHVRQVTWAVECHYFSTQRWVNHKTITDQHALLDHDVTAVVEVIMKSASHCEKDTQIQW